jgi:hypothetical protein
MKISQHARIVPTAGAESRLIRIAEWSSHVVSIFPKMPVILCHQPFTNGVKFDE